MSILTGIIFGIVPALQASGVNLRDALQETGRGSGESLRRNRLRSVLVGSEFALALLLMIGAGLMIRTFLALRAIDPGFQPHHVLSAVVSVAGLGRSPTAKACGVLSAGAATGGCAAGRRVGQRHQSCSAGRRHLGISFHD